MKKDIRIIKKIGVIASGTNGMQKELNVVSTEDGPIQYDFREWTLDHADYGDGISFDSDEARALFAVLKECFKNGGEDISIVDLPGGFTVDGTGQVGFDGKPDDGMASDEDLIQLLQERGIKYVDKRKNGGALWITGGHELDNIMIACGELGYTFFFTEKGGRVTKNQPGWYLPFKSKKQ